MSIPTEDTYAYQDHWGAVVPRCNRTLLTGLLVHTGHDGLVHNAMTRTSRVNSVR